MATQTTSMEKVHTALAKATSLPISTKHGIEISKFLRFKTTTFAKEYLEAVVAKKKAIPFKTHNRDVGHKPGPMAAGRYPVKAAKEFLRLIKSVEANAQDRGLNTGVLKISKLLANKASIPMTGGRHRQGTKRTHLEIEVVEGKAPVKKEKKVVKKEAPKVEKKEEVKAEPKPVAKEEPKVEAKPEPAKEEPKTEAKPEPKVETKAEVKAEEKPVEKKEEPAKSEEVAQ